MEVETDATTDTESYASALTDALAGNAEVESEEIEGDEYEESTDSEDSEPEIEVPELLSEKMTEREREIFEEMPREAQEFLIRRHDDVEKHLHKTRERESSQARLGSQVTEALGPVRNLFAQQGMDEASSVRYLAAQFGNLMQNPEQAVRDLATHFGVNLQEADVEDYDESPHVKQLQTEVRQLKQQLNQTQQATATRYQQDASAQIKSFAEEKDESGKLKHPYFDEVLDDIVVLMQNKRASTLQEAYEKAVKMNGKTPKQSALKKKKIAKAKTAAAGVKGEAGTSAGIPSLRETLTQAYREQSR